MRTIQKIISAGFATCALASASVPALAWTVWPDVDFEWYADVGKPMAAPVVEVYPAPREGYIWSPGHYENRGASPVWVPGRWIRDDYQQQLAMYGNRTSYVDNAAAQPMPPPVPADMPVIRDQAGNPVPMNPSAYPVDSIDSSRR
jgi:WXXGXW repeat (2 copies)